MFLHNVLESRCKLCDLLDDWIEIHGDIKRRLLNSVKTTSEKISNHSGVTGQAFLLKAGIHLAITTVTATAFE